MRPSEHTGGMPPASRAAGRRGGWPPGAQRSALAAALVAACLVLSAGEARLPALPFAAVFLFAAVQQDGWRGRVPNRLSLTGLAAALAWAGHAGGWSGVLASLLGVGAALALTLVPFALRWLGAGDVKAALVLGALWGAGGFASAFGWMTLAGAVVVGPLAASRQAPEPWPLRWLAGSLAGAGLPFAAALGLGAAAHQVWGAPF
jgi:Flp pilus assembly protein protease CpaA